MQALFIILCLFFSKPVNAQIIASSQVYYPLPQQFDSQSDISNICTTTIEDSFNFLKSIGVTVTTVADLQTISTLDVGMKGVTDNDLHFFCPLTQLTSLSIYNDNSQSPLTGNNLEQLSTLTKLIYLDLDSNKIPASQLYKLENLQNLETLRLIYNPISGPGLASLANLKNLKELRLQETTITGADLVDLIPLQSFPQLATLDLSGNNLSDNFVPLARLQALQTLDLINTGTTGKGLTSIAALPNLKTLMLGQASMIGGPGNSIDFNNLAALAQSKSLTELDLDNTGITDAAFPIIAKIQSLQILNLGTDWSYSVNGLKPLQALPHLSCLLIFPETYQSSLSQIQELFPKTTVAFDSCN